MDVAEADGHREKGHVEEGQHGGEREGEGSGVPLEDIP